MEEVPTHYRGVKVPNTLKHYWDQKPSARWWRMGIDAKAETFPIEVLPGQIYEDGDYRTSGRTVKVVDIEGHEAICVVLTDYDHVTNALEQGWTNYQSKVGSITRIKLRRFYANARGYRLVEPGAADA